MNKGNENDKFGDRKVIVPNMFNKDSNSKKNLSYWLKVFGVNFVLVVFAVIILELLYGNWFAPVTATSLGVVNNVSYTFNVQKLYPTDRETITYSRDSFGLRGLSSFNQPAKIDILTVGGSTTDQQYIDEHETWQYFLESKLDSLGKKTIISNAGKDGQSTFGHIKNFDLWFKHIPNLQPKYILFYVGINDFYKIKEDPIYDEILYHEYSIRSAFVSILRKKVGSIQARKHKLMHSAVDFDKLEWTMHPIRDIVLYESFDEEHLVGFKTRLQKLINLTEKMGAIPIFVSQPTMMFRFESDTLWGTKHVQKIDNKTYNGVDYYYLQKKLNNAMAQVCGQKYRYIDLADLKIWRKDDFYDHFHMNPKGTRKVAEELSKPLRDL